MGYPDFTNFVTQLNIKTTGIKFDIILITEHQLNIFYQLQ